MPEEIPHVTVKMPQSPALGRDVQGTDLIWVWDSVLGKLTQSPVSELPFGSGGGSGGTMLGSPFKVRSGDTQVVIEETAVGSGIWRTIISDVRLLGKTDYPVSCTQLNNACFDDSYLTYNSGAGSVTIQPFKLLPGKLIILYPDGLTPAGGSGGGSVAALQEQIDELKRMLAPFTPTLSGANGGLVPWGKPAIDIPVGWAEATEYRGRTLVGMVADASDAEFGYGKTGGSATHTNTEEEMFPHDHDEDSPGANGSHPGGSSGYDRPNTKITQKTSKTGGWLGAGGDLPAKVAKPYSIMNPYRIVMFIKYVGI